MTQKRIIEKLYSDEYNLKHKMNMSKLGISKKLLEVMKEHIGKDNAINKSQLFEKLYNIEENENNLNHWFIWDLTKKAMHYVRKTTKCFIAMRRTNGAQYEFFVVEDRNDAKEYVDVINKNIKQMKSMITRAITAADENWSDMEWVLSGSSVKKLNQQSKVDKIENEQDLLPDKIENESNNEQDLLSNKKGGMFNFFKK